MTEPVQMDQGESSHTRAGTDRERALDRMPGECQDYLIQHQVIRDQAYGTTLAGIR